MITKIEKFNQSHLKKDLPNFRQGDTVRVYQKISVFSAGKNTSGDKEKGKGKEKFQIFEGLILAISHKKEIGATITVRKVISGVGVEKIFPIHSPIIEKIEILRRAKTRRAKLYYLRTAKGRKARLKKKEFKEAIAPEGLKPSSATSNASMEDSQKTEEKM